MKRIVFSLVLVLVFSAFASAQIEYIRFAVPDEENSANLYNLEPYYFLHYFYKDVLYFFDLMEPLDLTTKTLMFEKMFNNLSADYPVGIFLKIAGWDEPLCISYRVLSNEDGMFVVMVTNYDLKQQEILADFSENCYARLYYIFGDKLVNGDKLFSAEKEEDYQTNLNNLADLYIFDERVENDSLVEDLLFEHLDTTESAVLRYVGYLTLAQYYMITDDLEKAEENLAEAEMMFADYFTEEDKTNLGLPFIVTKEEVQIMALVKGAAAGNVEE